MCALPFCCTLFVKELNCKILPWMQKSTNLSLELLGIYTHEFLFLSRNLRNIWKCHYWKCCACSSFHEISSCILSVVKLPILQQIYINLHAWEYKLLKRTCRIMLYHSSSGFTLNQGPHATSIVQFSFKESLIETKATLLYFWFGRP